MQPLQILPIILLLVASAAPAQDAPPPTTRPAMSGLGVQLFTMGPGPAVWERFGHNAVAVIDHDSGVNRAYNFGVFDFNDADFLARFVRGEMRYWMEPADTLEMVGPYVQQGRDVWGQALALSQPQARAMFDALEVNALPHNKYYTYNYYTDNCSTRIRDVIDRAAGGQVRPQLEAVRTGSTYRHHTLIGLAEAPLLAFGVDFALSAYGDRELNAWEESFLPVRLMGHLRRVMVDDGAGGRRPLVEMDRTILAADDPRFRLPERPPTRWPAMLAIGLAGGAAMALAGLRAPHSAFARWLAAGLWGGWGLIAGLGGLFLLGMWLLTAHVASYANENLLQASPAAIGLAVLGPLAAFGRARKMAWPLVAFCGASAVAGLALKPFPGFGQQNWTIMAMTLPLWAGAAAGVRWRFGGAAPRAPEAGTDAAINQERR